MFRACGNILCIHRHSDDKLNVCLCSLPYLARSILNVHYHPEILADLHSVDVIEFECHVVFQVLSY